MKKIIEKLTQENTQALFTTTKPHKFRNHRRYGLKINNDETVEMSYAEVIEILQELQCKAFMWTGETDKHMFGHEKYHKLIGPDARGYIPLFIGNNCPFVLFAKDVYKTFFKKPKV